MDQFAGNLELSQAFVADHCHLRIGSLPEWITLAVEFLVERARQCGAVPPVRANRLTMALHEALTNSVIHGNLAISSELKERGDQAFAEAVASRCALPEFASRVVDVQASYDGQNARWTFADQGAGFDVQGAMQQLDKAELDLQRPSGRGLFLIRAFVDEMRYDDGGRRLTLTLHSKPEKRHHPRYPLAQTVRVAPVGADGEVSWDASQEALIRDVSTHGIGLLQSHLAGSKRVHITIPTSGEPISLPAEVCHLRKVGDMVEVGCRFESAPALPGGLGGSAWPADPTADALGRLVDRLVRQQRPLEERRVAPRLSYTECISVEPTGQEALPGYARNLSRSGIAFFTTTAVLFDAVRLHLPATADAPAISVRAQIVRCVRLTDGFYDVGARFLPG
jgi:anti-sigma regulatory factor (Ser/Thr protein kinase)